jgi:hypothetical protein
MAFVNGPLPLRSCYFLLTSRSIHCAVSLPTCGQALCEDTCAISAASFIADFWMLNKWMIMAVNSELKWLNMGGECSSYFDD